MEIDPALEKHVPDLGYISPGPEGYFAWQLMEHLAKIEIEKASWEQTANGYRLSGVSKVPPGRELVTSDDQPPPSPLPTTVPNRFAWEWLALAVGFVFVASGAFILYRRRIKKTPAASPTT